MNQDIIYDNSVSIRLNEKNLSIHYQAVNGNAIYDLCSLEGRILVTGKLESDPSDSIDLSGYPEGMYNLFILDGDRVIKKSFRL